MNLYCRKNPQKLNKFPFTPMNEQHEMVLALADELVRMQQNLARMDSAVRGYKQLQRSVQRMNTILQAAGYEVVDMLGQPYSDGMRVVASFNLDDSMPPGQQLITAVSRPQVNYQGEMIQVAMVTVSQKP